MEIVLHPIKALTDRKMFTDVSRDSTGDWMMNCLCLHCLLIMLGGCDELPHQALNRGSVGGVMQVLCGVQVQCGVEEREVLCCV